jgi:hypothetical protein
MVNEPNRAMGINRTLAILLVLAVVALGVIGFLYYRQQQDVLRIDVPGFSGKVTKDKGVDIQVGKDRYQVDKDR